MLTDPNLQIVVTAGQYAGIKLGVLAMDDPGLIGTFVDDVTQSEAVRNAARHILDRMIDTGRVVSTHHDLLAPRVQKAVDPGELFSSILTEADAYLKDPSHRNPDNPGMFLGGTLSTRYTFRDYQIVPRLRADKSLVLMFIGSESGEPANRNMPSDQWMGFFKESNENATLFNQHAERVFPSSIAAVMRPVVRYTKDGDVEYQDPRIEKREKEEAVVFEAEGVRVKYQEK